MDAGGGITRYVPLHLDFEKIKNEKEGRIPKIEII
jgi:hypothetical protein